MLQYTEEAQATALVLGLLLAAVFPEVIELVTRLALTGTEWV